jgi:RecB family exonuclease
VELVWSLGTVGGNPAHPEGALEWSRRAVERDGELQDQLERARAAGDDAEQAGVALRARDIERTLTDLRAVLPALVGLVGVARVVAAGRPLSATWPALQEFLARWLLQPGEGARVHALLDERLGPLAVDAACGSLTGDEALRLVEETLVSIRLPAGRFGEPAVYVGAVSEAAGLRFRAVRVIGLAEGHLPSIPREDPVIPDALRARLGGAGAGGRIVSLPTAADRALEALHALDRVVRDATERIALSAPRVTGERSLREPSAILLEALAALARPNAVTGDPVTADVSALRRDAFAPARASAARFRSRTPIGEAAWQDAVALGALGMPRRWRDLPALDPERVAALQREEAAALDGIIGAGARGGAVAGAAEQGDRRAAIPVPGLTADLPISPSALHTLLECPYHFLLSRLLRWDEPAAAPAQREIGQPAYGALVHAAAEAFHRAHGERFAALQGALGDWLARGDEVSDRVFAEFLLQYPLAGGAVRDQQRQRLRADMRDLLEHDWSVPRRFVAVERPFGWTAPVELPAGGRSLFVRGRIDRIDVDGPMTLVRDIKTGRDHPRRGSEADPAPGLDLQLALYGLVAARLAAEWGVPDRIAAAYVYVGRRTAERAWRADFHQALEPAAREWLALAADLLAARAFPRTPDHEDCTFCCFRPVCGDDVHERSARLLTAGDPLLGRLARLKGIARGRS